MEFISFHRCWFCYLKMISRIKNAGYISRGEERYIQNNIKLLNTQTVKVSQIRWYYFKNGYESLILLSYTFCRYVWFMLCNCNRTTNFRSSIGEVLLQLLFVYVLKCSVRNTRVLMIKYMLNWINPLECADIFNTLDESVGMLTIHLI